MALGADSRIATARKLRRVGLINTIKNHDFLNLTTNITETQGTLFTRPVNKYVDYKTCYCRSVSSRDAAAELTGMYLQRDLQ